MKLICHPHENEGQDLSANEYQQNQQYQQYHAVWKMVGWRNGGMGGWLGMVKSPVAAAGVYSKKGQPCRPLVAIGSGKTSVALWRR